MRSDSLISKTICAVLEKFLSVKENKSKDLGTPGKILIIRQHNKLGDLLAGVSLFRAIKETYPGSNITLVGSPFNSPGMINNKFIDRIFVYDKKKLFNPFYLLKAWRLLREEYDIVIVPVIVTISSLSNFLSLLFILYSDKYKSLFNSLLFSIFYCFYYYLFFINSLVLL